MRRLFHWVLALSAAATLPAAEKTFDFSRLKEGQAPPGFRSAAGGAGKPGDWRIVLDEVPSLMQPLTPQAPSVSKRPVLAQMAQDPTDEHFPLLIYEEEVFGDFTLTTRFKTVAGSAERMAGIAFRLQDETNYYVLRASSLGNTFRFYKVVNGERGTIIGPEVPIPSGVWHELGVECKGNKIRCFLNGKEAFPTLTDSSFTKGKIAFWTKSDSVSYFTDTRIVYTPREPPAQALVRELLRKQKRLLGLKIYVAGEQPNTTRLVASRDETELGAAGGDTELKVITSGQIYYVKGDDSATVVMPLRDRNGEPIAAARVIMTTFPGQTQQNAVIRATPIVKSLQAKIRSLQDLVD